MTTATNTPTMILTASPASIASISPVAIKLINLIKGQARKMPASTRSILPSGTNPMSNLVLPAYRSAISTVKREST